MTKTIKCLLPNFAKRGGLVTVVAQDAANGEILMVAHANEPAYRKTLETGLAHYWSTSRNELWQKGATSGNTQRVVRVCVDCDGDALIYKVDQTGAACHTGERSCFYRDVLHDVAAITRLKPDDWLNGVELEVSKTLLTDAEWNWKSPQAPLTPERST